MNRCDKYKDFFTAENLMGPNSILLLDEMLRRIPFDVSFGRTLDLGCGRALTSLFLANETPAGSVYAYDLWTPATENYERIRKAGAENKVIPVHGDAMDLPFAQEYFDAIVSVDAYHYFGCREGVFGDRILPFVRRGGCALIAVPGLKEEPRGDMRELFLSWATDGDDQDFLTTDHWRALLEEECGDRCDVVVTEAGCSEDAWNEWYATGHEYALRDREFLSRGLNGILNFVLMYIRKKQKNAGLFPP